ncbi:MAG: hypothetical protein JWP19_2244 [Rhodoglobus sp.]|nr:hypothetical protein [Rhodoglobus sp.]
MTDKEPKSIAQRFFDLCLLLLGGVLALWLALQFLAQFWGWLLLIAGIAGGIWLAVVIVRARRNRW